MILEPDSGPLAATVQQQARQDNRLAYTLSEEYDTMHTQHLPLSTAQPQARLTQSTTSPLYSHVPHVSASRHDDAWGACVHAKQTRTLQHGPSTGTSGVPPCSVRQGHAMRAASEGGLGHRTGQGSHTAVGTACTAARSTCRSGSAGGALQGAAVCGDATGSELTIIRKCGQGAFGAGKQTRCSYVHCHVHCVPQPSQLADSTIVVCHHCVVETCTGCMVSCRNCHVPCTVICKTCIAFAKLVPRAYFVVSCAPQLVLHSRNALATMHAVRARLYVKLSHQPLQG